MYQGDIKLINGVKITAFSSVENVIKKVKDKKEEKGYTIAHYMYWVSFVKSKKNSNYMEALKDSDFIFPDGIGLLTYIKILYNKKVLNLNGTDLNPILLDCFNEQKYNISLYGTTEKSIVKCAEKLKLRGININYYQDGYSELAWDMINKNSVLFVGKGSPNQEIWVKNNINMIKEKQLIVVTVGGYFDFESEFYTRAPNWVRKIKCEWIFRIIDNPKLQIPKYVNNLYFFPYILEGVTLKLLKFFKQ